MEAVMAKNGCDPRVYYQALNGNQVRNLFRPDTIEELMDVFKDHFDVENLRLLMLDFGKLMSWTRSTILTDAEIEEISILLQGLKENLRLVHPDLGVIPKLHILYAHLVPFMKLHKTWGKSSEQGIEGFNALFNKVERRFNPVKGLELRAILMLQYFGNLNYLFDCGENWDVEE